MKLENISNNLINWKKSIIDNASIDIIDLFENKLDKINDDIKLEIEGFQIQNNKFNFAIEGINYFDSSRNKIIINFDFNHFDELKSDILPVKITKHKAIITPDFILGFKVKVTGIDYDNTIQYMEEVFQKIFML